MQRVEIYVLENSPVKNLFICKNFLWMEHVISVSIKERYV